MTQPTEQGPVEVRPLLSSDLGAVREMYERLSPLSLERRFLSPRTSGPQWELDYLATAGGPDRFVVVAHTGREVVGIARYHRTSESNADVAVVVDDEWQRRGLARRMLRKLAIEAVRSGVRRFDMSILADNDAALGLLRKLAPQKEMHLGLGVLEAIVPLQRAA
jgi:acetyltransferase